MIVNTKEWNLIPHIFYKKNKDKEDTTGGNRKKLNRKGKISLGIYFQYKNRSNVFIKEFEETVKRAKDGQLKKGKL